MKFLFIYSLKLKLDSTENDCEIVNDVIAAHAVTLVTSSSYWIGERWKCWRMNWRDTLTLQRKKPTEIWMTSFQCTEKKTNREKPVSGRAQKTFFFFRWKQNYCRSSIELLFCLGQFIVLSFDFSCATGFVIQLIVSDDLTLDRDCGGVIKQSRVRCVLVDAILLCVDAKPCKRNM